ncbi:nitroreductase family protein, partial [Gilvimarinus algae]
MTDFDSLTAQRRSVRAFTDQPVLRAQMEQICTVARRAPSGANLQPGSFHVLTGAALTGLSARLMQAIDDGAPIETEYSYFPRPMPAALKARQRAAGYALYQALG